MTHRQKLRLARRLMTAREKVWHIAPFMCEGWAKLKADIKISVIDREQIQQSSSMRQKSRYILK